MQEERERERALHFLVQEMAQWKMQSSPATPHKSVEKVISNSFFLNRYSTS